MFPDHQAVPGTGQLAASRLLRISGLRPDDDAVLGPELLGQLGRRWYAMAARSARAHGAATTAGLAVAAEMGERFGDSASSAERRHRPLPVPAARTVVRPVLTRVRNGDVVWSSPKEVVSRGNKQARGYTFIMAGWVTGGRGNKDQTGLLGAAA